MECKTCKRRYEYTNSVCCEECAQFLREIYEKENSMDVKYKGKHKGAGGYGPCKTCNCIDFVYLDLISIPNRWKCYSCLTEDCP